MTQTTTQHSCEQCSEEFEHKQNTHNRFCTRKCAYRARRRQRVQACEQCGEEFEQQHKDQQFCSRRCSNSARATHGRETHDGFYAGIRRQVETRNCLYCLDPFEVPPSSKQECCSLSCSAKLRNDKLHGKIISAEEPIDHTNYVWVLNWLIFRYYRVEDPVYETDEYQSAWVGLLKACRNYRGNQPFTTFAIAWMRKQIYVDLYGKTNGEREMNRTTARMKRRSFGCSREADPVDLAIEHELREKFDEQLVDMHQTHREIIRCRALEGMNNQETSEALDLSPKYASNAFSVARQQLREVRWCWPDQYVTDRLPVHT